MGRLKRLFAVTLVAVIAISSCLAVSPVGTWSGKVNVTLPPLPAGAPPDLKKQYEEAIKEFKTYRIKLIIKSNKTFKMSAPAFMGQPANNAEGTWTQSGNTVTFKTLKENGKKATGESAKPEKVVLSKDGKSFSIKLPASAGANGTIDFTKK